MSLYDYIVFGIYILGMVAVAIVFYKKNKNFKDMFAAGGESPWWVSGLSSYMTLFSAGTFVVWGGLAYKHGLVAISINMASGCAALLVGFFIAGKWKMLKIATPAEYIQIRFGKMAERYYTWMLMFVRIIGSAVALYALSTILHPLMPENSISANDIILICGLVIVIYTIVGGLWAVLMTDVLQFIVLSISVLFTVWLAFDHVDSMQDFVARVPETFLNWTSAGYTWYFLFGWMIIHLFMLGAEWAFVQRFLSVPSRKDAKKSALLFGALYVVSPAIWLLPAMLYRSINADADPEQAYILMSQSLLPLGMLGLVAAAMFSATASMVSSQINVFAGVLTDNIYLHWLRPKANDQEALWAGRMTAAVLGVVIVMLAAAIPYLGGAETVVFSMMSLFISPLFAPALWGLFSARISGSAVWFTAGSAAIVGYILKFALATEGSLAHVSWLSNVAQWSQANSKMMDIYAGVVTPLVVLCIAELVGYLQEYRAKGWLELQPQDNQESAPVSADNYLPLFIVTISIWACAAITAVLTALNQQNQSALFVLTLILLIIASWLTVVLRRPGFKPVLAEGEK
ncbi:sodium:solute symporter family transporter [Paraglaciecola arctica]|uniref:sodium:solute symporter family transporter n=1 Tax=Paraglaciecola arctica TaxID=1128911 RepID=UPI001C067E12|nr:hypothetical protein [Paraglaciecola arctica]MBU3005568.1 hypothetical protein [Paraglaciecola arctica]